MSKETKEEKAAESGKPLTAEELQAVIGGNNPIPWAGDNPNQGEAPDPPPFPGDITTSG